MAIVAPKEDVTRDWSSQRRRARSLRELSNPSEKFDAFLTGEGAQCRPERRGARQPDQTPLDTGEWSLRL